MCFKDGKFYLNKINENQFKLVEVTKSEKLIYFMKQRKVLN